jgi:cell division septum initiation protein DivIVA
MFNFFRKKSPMTHPATARVSSPPALVPTTLDDQIKMFMTTKERVEHIKRQITKATNDLEAPPSIIGRLARFWGSRPLWQKAVGSVLVVGSFIAAGIFFSIPALIIAGATFAAVIILGGLLLEDEYRANKKIKEKVQKSMSGLADVLGSIILSLDNVSTLMATEVDKFQKENKKLSEKIGELEDTIEKFKEQVTALSKVEKTISTSSDKMTKTAEEYEAQLAALTLKIEELEGIRQSLAERNKQLSAVGNVLQQTVSTFTDAALADASAKEAFQARLQAFVDNTEVSFDRIAERICEAERELVAVTAALNHSNERYEELLDKHDVQITLFEELIARKKLELHLPANWRATIFRPKRTTNDEAAPEAPVFPAPKQTM